MKFLLILLLLLQQTNVFAQSKEYRKQLKDLSKTYDKPTAFGFTVQVINGIKTVVLYYTENNETEELFIPDEVMSFDKPLFSRIEFYQYGYGVYLDKTLFAIIFNSNTEYILFRRVKSNTPFSVGSYKSDAYAEGYLVLKSWWNNNFRGELTVDMINYIIKNFNKY
jgi:hypothetical protein